MDIWEKRWNMMGCAYSYMNHSVHDFIEELDKPNPSLDKLQQIKKEVLKDLKDYEKIADRSTEGPYEYPDSDETDDDLCE